MSLVASTNHLLLSPIAFAGNTSDASTSDTISASVGNVLSSFITNNSFLSTI